MIIIIMTATITSGQCVTDINKFSNTEEQMLSKGLT
jgi:hypothetical protein